MKKLSVILAGLILLSISTSAFAANVNRTAQGQAPASIQPTIDAFFNDITGTVDNGTGGSYKTGRREIDLGLIPDNFAEPNIFPGDFFKTTVPRGALMRSTCRSSLIAVSADVINPTGTPIAFQNIEPTYLNNFVTFNSQRMLAMKWSTAGWGTCSSFMITFSIPGTNIPATVKGFGVVYTDTDTGTNTQMRFFDVNGAQLGGNTTFGALSNSGGLSFVGISYNAGERIAAVEIMSGGMPLAQGGIDGPGFTEDRVAIGAMFYAEPRAAEFHSGDFDGDGSGDSAIFRPSTAQWFTLNSGSNTFSIEQWGANGDIPIDGDFDGDSRADLCIFRPSNGQWWLKRSSDGSVFAATFGQSGDKPTAADYDKDGKSDMAIWRPSSGNYFVLRSSTNFSTFYSYPFGQNGDIPVQGGAQ